MRIKKITAIVMVIIMIVSLGSALPQTKAYAAGNNVYKESEVIKLTELVNLERAKIGVDPLTYSPAICGYPATKRADEIASSFSHNRPEKHYDPNLLDKPYSPFTVYRMDTETEEDDIHWGKVGENIAGGQTTVEEVFIGWFNSDKGHKEAILDPAYTHMGLGHYQNNGLNYWAQLFIGGFGVSKISIENSANTLQVAKGTSLDDVLANIRLKVTSAEPSLGVSYLPLFNPGNSCPTFKVLNYNPNQEGKQTIKIQYKGASTSFDVIVGTPAQVTLSGIQAEYTGGAKTVGQFVNAAEVSVTAIYSDGSTKPVTSGYSVASNQLVEGFNDIKVTYQGQSATIKVPATAPVTLSSIQVQIKKGVTKYAGDTISASDFTVIGVYSDGSTQVEGGTITVSPTTLKAGDNKITVTCNGKTASYTLNCKEKVTIKSIAVSYEGGKKHENDTISAADFKVIATYSDNSTKDVSSSIDLSSTKLSAGTNNIVVSFGGKTETISVPAEKLIAKELIISNNFTSKTEGDTFSATDFVVKVKYNNGKTAAVDGWAIKNVEKPLKAGKNTVTFVYGTLTQEYVVEAAPKTTQAPTQAPTDVPTQAPTQTPTDAPTQAPTEAPTQTPTKAETTTAESTTEEETVESSEENTTEEDTTEADTTEEETTLEVSSEEAPKKLELKYKGGAKYVGDSISAEDFTVYAVYEDGSRIDVSEDALISHKAFKEGDNEVIISYEGKEVIFYLNVSEKPEETTTAAETEPETEATTQALTEAPTQEITEHQTKGQASKSAEDDSDEQEIRDLQKLVLLIAAVFVLIGFVMFFISIFVKKKRKEEEDKGEKNAPKSETTGEK